MQIRKGQAPVSEKARKGWRKYLWNLLIAVDQFANTVTLGDPDETISSRAGKAKAEGKRWARVLCWGLNFIDPGHCVDSIELNEGKDQVL